MNHMTRFHVIPNQGRTKRFRTPGGTNVRFVRPGNFERIREERSANGVTRDLINNSECRKNCNCLLVFQLLALLKLLLMTK